MPASGGHSRWSTVEDGLIIDLSRYKDVAVDPQNHEVTISGGVLMKELQLALAEEQQMTSTRREHRTVPKAPIYPQRWQTTIPLAQSHI